MAGLAAAARLVDATRLRAMWLALRRDARPFGHAGDPDPALLAPVERPFDSVADAEDGLGTLKGRLRDRRDRRAVFLSIYVRMTRAVRERIERGGFRDPDWMRRYTTTFANYYRAAFLAFEQGRDGAVPAPWRIAFGAAGGGDALVVQNAFLGVNAHINYDLALALDDVGIDPNRGRKYADHRAIDGILARLVDVQQEALAEVYAAGLDDVDAALGDLDEALTLDSMTACREWAWRVAVVRTDADWPPVDSYARWVLRTVATGGAFVVLGPALDPALLSTLRRVETGHLDLGDVLARIDDRIEEVDLATA
ncbi:MAG: DUF5995 family protein [Haloferacaceae archaeon]